MKESQTKKTLLLNLALLLFAPAFSLHAAVIALDCSKKTLASVIAKLDKSVPNTVNISGSCTEDVVVSGFKDLTLIGVGGASITATGPNGTGTALLVNERSQLTVQELTVNGGVEQGVFCTGRSSCVFRNVTIQGGGNGITVQDQSGVDILGSSVIQNSLGTGIGVYGASTVNIRPDLWNSNLEVAGPVISGHAHTECDTSVTPPVCFIVGNGAIVQDGSFLRSDNATFSGNGTGVFAQKNAVIKIYTEDSGHRLGGVINNIQDGIVVRWSSTAGISTPISGNGRADNGGAGIRVGALSFVQDQGVTFSGNNQDVVCQHSTAISAPFGWCNH